VSPESNLFRAARPKEAGWGRQNVLLANAVDALNWLVWRQSSACEDGQPPPDPIERPGVTLPGKRPGSRVKRAATISKLREVQGLREDPDRDKKLAKLFGTGR
jgi:Family of unknown function (DUF5361)